MAQEKLEAFRTQQRTGYIGAGYSGWVHLAISVGGSVVLSAFLLRFVHRVRPAEWLTVPGGVLVANFVEYVAHRVPMHRPTRFLRAVYHWHTMQHHRFFTPEAMAFESMRDLKVVLFPPLIVSLFLGGAGVPISLALGFGWSANAGLLYSATSLLYFGVYELLHLAFHLPVEHPLAQVKWLRRMGDKHVRHHLPRLMSQANFNVFFAWMDRLFGTYR